MYWPRLQLTEEEKSYSIAKYYDPNTKFRVLRRMYGGTLRLNSINRAPTFGFNIARRCRVFAMTASGDLHRFRIQLQDSSGENYIAEPTSAAHLFGGYNAIPPGLYGIPLNPDSSFGGVYGPPNTYAPFVFEPNIVLDPNQVLLLSGISPTPYTGQDYFMETVFHVWEFPAMFGSSPQ
jgi:hypothetical protein